MAPTNVTEIWLPATGFDGYEVSSLGRVRTWRPTGPKRPWRSTPHIMAVLIRNDGYASCKMVGENGLKTVKVHAVVARAFHGDPAQGQECRHRNGIRSDNRSDNLLWGTHKENMCDTIVHGTTAGRKFRGSGHASAKLGENDVRDIRMRHTRGETGRSIGRAFGVTAECVYAIVKRKTWAHIA